MKTNNNQGFSLIEMLVVLTIFTVIALVSSETIILTLIGAKKAGSISKVRQNLDLAIGQMERQLHNAKSISECPNSDTSQISFADGNNNLVNFSCVGVNNNNQPSYVASSSASLTSSDITITSCSFVCTPGTGNAPPYVTISITAKEINGSSAPITSTTQVTLRSY